MAWPIWPEFRLEDVGIVLWILNPLCWTISTLYRLPQGGPLSFSRISGDLPVWPSKITSRRDVPSRYARAVRQRRMLSKVSSRWLQTLTQTIPLRPARRASSY